MELQRQVVAKNRDLNRMRRQLEESNHTDKDEAEVAAAAAAHEALQACRLYPPPLVYTAADTTAPAREALQAELLQQRGAVAEAEGRARAAKAAETAALSKVSGVSRIQPSCNPHLTLILRRAVEGEKCIPHPTLIQPSSNSTLDGCPRLTASCGRCARGSASPRPRTRLGAQSPRSRASVRGHARRR